MIDCIYYNDDVRCYRDGVVERKFKKKGWSIVENTANENGYNKIEINGTSFKRHRLLAYCFLGLDNIVGESGRDDCIDHINGIKLDNRVANLRITTIQGNQHNHTTAKGYYWDKQKKKYHASIGLNGKNIYLGLYDTEEEARQAYLDAKPIYHKL